MPESRTYAGVNHLALVTGDMDTTIRFYRDLLGLRLVALLGRPGYRHYFFRLNDDNALAFFEWPGVEPMPRKDHGLPVRGQVGWDHVSIGVDKPEELLELRERLIAAGVDVSLIVDHGTIYSIYFFDPNGIPLEISVPAMEPSEDMLSDDPAPTAAALEGPEPVPGRWPEPSGEQPRFEDLVVPGPGQGLRGR